MPNWKAIADQIENGLYGEQRRKAASEMQEMEMNKQRMSLASNADARAAAAEGRASDDHSFNVSQRPMLMKQLQQKIDAGELSLQEAQNQMELFDAEGGVAGEAGRRKAKLGREEQAHTQNIAASQAQVYQGQQRINLEKTEQERLAKQAETREQISQLELDIAKQTKERRIKDINDPVVSDAQRLTALTRMYDSAGSEQEAAEILAEIKKIAMKNEERKLGAVQQTGANAANPQAIPIGRKDTKGVMDQWGYK